MGCVANRLYITHAVWTLIRLCGHQMFTQAMLLSFALDYLPLCAVDLVHTKLLYVLTLIHIITTSVVTSMGERLI